MNEEESSKTLIPIEKCEEETILYAIYIFPDDYEDVLYDEENNEIVLEKSNTKLKRCKVYYNNEVKRLLLSMYSAEELSFNLKNLKKINDDPYSKFELLDRVSILSDNFNSFILEHNSINLDPNAAELAEKISSDLWRLYGMFGRLNDTED